MIKDERKRKKRHNPFKDEPKIIKTEPQRKKKYQCFKQEMLQLGFILTIEPSEGFDGRWRYEHPRRKICIEGFGVDRSTRQWTAFRDATHARGYKELRDHVGRWRCFASPITAARAAMKMWL